MGQLNLNSSPQEESEEINNNKKFSPKNIQHKYSSSESNK